MVDAGFRFPENDAEPERREPEIAPRAGRRSGKPPQPADQARVRVLLHGRSEPQDEDTSDGICVVGGR